MSVLFNQPWQQVFDSSGNTLPGAKLYFYAAGTSTPAVVYADVGLGTPLSNPVVANAGGRFQPIYLDDGMYKAVLKTSDDVLIWTADNIQTTSEDADVSIALAAIEQTSISAGYTEEEAHNPTNFVKSVYKYANRSNWFVEDETSVADAYVLNGLDDYTRLNDYFLSQNVWFVTTHTNETAEATVNVAELGEKRIYRSDSSPIEPGDIYGCVHLIYNGASFILQTPSTVNQYGDQNIYGTKAFENSPLVPTPDNEDSSQAAANTEWVLGRIAVNRALDYVNTVTTDITDDNLITNINDGEYTATQDGVLYLTSTANIARYVWIDGVYICRLQSTASSGATTRVVANFSMSVGDTIIFSNSSSSATKTSTSWDKVVFVPYKKDENE